MLLGAVGAFVLRLEMPNWVFGSLASILVLSGTFLGGCYIGLKNEKLALPLCVVGIVIDTLIGSSAGAVVKTMDLKTALVYVALLGSSILGGYVGSTYFRRAEDPCKGPQGRPPSEAE